MTANDPVQLPHLLDVNGLAEHLGVEGRVDLVTGTLGKALGGASGGYVAGSRAMVEWLRQKARPYLFSNSLAPVIAAVRLKVLDLVEQGDALRARLRDNARSYLDTAARHARASAGS